MQLLKRMRNNFSRRFWLYLEVIWLFKKANSYTQRILAALVLPFHNLRERYRWMGMKFVCLVMSLMFYCFFQSILDRCLQENRFTRQSGMISLWVWMPRSSVWFTASGRNSGHTLIGNTSEPSGEWDTNLIREHKKSRPWGRLKLNLHIFAKKIGHFLSIFFLFIWNL